MIQRPLVSVIVPAYEHERFVEEALRSVIGQTYEPLEIIVLDDGSSDGTFSRIEALVPDLRRRFVRAHVARKDHEGSACNISRCLELANSDLVYMLDSDDVAHPEAIERLVPLLEMPDVALAAGDNRYLDGDGRPYAPARCGLRHETLVAFHTADRPEFVAARDFGSYKSLIRGNYVPNGWLLRRSAVRAVGGYPSGFVLDDWPLLLKLAKQFRIVYAGAILADYRVHAGNMSQLHAERLILDTVCILLTEHEWCRAHGLEDAWWGHIRQALGSLTPDQIERSDLIARVTATRATDVQTAVQTLVASAVRMVRETSRPAPLSHQRTLRPLLPPPNGSLGQRIHLYALTWNDARLLPFFFRHYDRFVQRYVIFDDGSDDGSLELLEAHPRVEVRRFERADSESFVRSELRFYDECWKESRGSADWVFVVDIDEHLHHPDLAGYLARCQAEQVTAVPALGFEMVSNTFPEENEWLCETQSRGVPSLDMCKLAILAPDAIAELRHAPGGHSSRPIGAVLPPRDEVLLLHYKALGADYLIARHSALGARLGPEDRAQGWAHQWSSSTAELREEFESWRAHSVDTLAATTAARLPGSPWWAGVLPRVEDRARVQALEADRERLATLEAADRERLATLEAAHTALETVHAAALGKLEDTTRESEARAVYLSNAERSLTSTRDEIRSLESALADSKARVTEIERSRTWRWTASVRHVLDFVEGRTSRRGAAMSPICAPPELSWASPVALLGDLARYGSLGFYVWHSRRIIGWTRGLEAPALARASHELQGAPVIVEIGGFLGCSTVLLAGARKLRRSGRIHCVDPFDCSGDAFSSPAYQSIAASLKRSLREVFESNIRRAGLTDWVTVHQTNAAAAAREWQGSIDMLHLDGDYSQQGATETYIAWQKWLRPGGVIAVNGTHATEDNHDGPMHVVAEFIHAPAYRDIRRVETITLAVKN
jgi:glycosyltransferase involved in cell wall biosynthesis/predicted O-methyltransferase YrrM